MKSTPNTTNIHQTGVNTAYLYVFPWIYIEKPIRLQQIALYPWPSKSTKELLENDSEWDTSILENIIERFRDPSGKPVESLGIVFIKSSPWIHENNHEAHRLIELFHIALRLLHYRYYDYTFQENRYMRYQMFRFQYEPSGTGSFSYQNWFQPSRQEIPDSISMPDGLRMNSINFPVRRIREVLQSIENANSVVIHRIRLVLNILDIISLQSSQKDLALSLHLMCDAISHLFGGDCVLSDDVLAFQIEDLWTFPFREYEYHPSIFKNKQIKQVTKVQSFRVVKQPSSKKSWLQAWLLELYRLKNEMSIGNTIHPKEYAWTIVQHLRIATEIVPLTILIMLSKDPESLLPLKNEDEKRIKNVDAYIQYAKAVWYNEGYPHPDQPEWLLGGTQPNLWDSIPEK